MIRRRPIPKSPYRWTRTPKEKSLRWELILGGAVRKFVSDGREVCQDNAAGRREYARRVDEMLERQDWNCCLCGERIRSRSDATFEHARRRGMGAAFRDDRTETNGAAHWVCNVEKG